MVTTKERLFSVYSLKAISGFSKESGVAVVVLIGALITIDILADEIRSKIILSSGESRMDCSTTGKIIGWRLGLRGKLDLRSNSLFNLLNRE